MGGLGPVGGGIRNGNWHLGVGGVAGSVFLLLLFSKECRPREPSGSCEVGSWALWSLQSPSQASLPGQLGPDGEAGLWRVGVSTLAEACHCYPVASMTR